MLLSFLFALTSSLTLSLAQPQIGDFPQQFGFSQVPTSFQRRSSNVDVPKGAKLIRPFPFRRPIVIRRPIVAVAPNYNTGAQQVPVRPMRPVFVRRPFRPLRPMRPFGLRPMVSRPVMSSVQRPVYVGQGAAPVRAPLPLAPLPLPFPQGASVNSGRLPDIELRTQEKRNYKQEIQEIKKPLLKILNSGAKIALQKVLQKASESKNASSLKTKGSPVGFEEVINGAEIILRHYLEMKSLKNKTGMAPQKRADNSRFPGMSETLFSMSSPSKSETASTTSRPKVSTTTSTKNSKQTPSRSPVNVTDDPTGTEQMPDVRSTAVPNLLSPWQSSNLLNLIKNSPLYNSIQSSVAKSSSQINWKAANVSLVNAKIVNDTKGRRMGYIPSAWYSEDSDEVSRKSTTKLVSLTALETTTSPVPSRHTSRSDGGESSTETVVSSSDETPISAEGIVMTTKSRPIDSSSEEVSQHRLLVVGKGSAKPLLYSSSDEARSEEVPLWVLTTRKPTHSFGFGHSVVINNHRAPSQNAVKRRRTTTTRRPTTAASAETSPSEPFVVASTTPPTSNSRFPLEVFDTDDFNTTIVHQNIITIAKPTRPFVVHPTQRFTTQPTTSASDEAAKSSQPSKDVSFVNWDDSDENSFNNRIPEESRPTPSRLRAPSSTTPMPHMSSLGSSSNSKRKPSKKTGAPQTDSTAVEATTSRPWLANTEAQFANKPINQVPAILNPFGSVIQLFPNSVFRILQTIGGLVFALPTLLTFGFMAAMLMV